MEKMTIEKTENIMREILDQGINNSNIEYLYKLAKIKHMAKEDECMEYGRYDTYGARRRDSRGRYMGHDHIDRISDDYGRYMESRSKYGAAEETDRSFHYMVKSLEDFIKFLHEEADTSQQKQMLREALQRSMM